MRAISILLFIAVTSASYAQNGEPRPAPFSGVISGAPQNIIVTLYRDPDRPSSQGMMLDELYGFALITETRIVDLPAGPVTIRFEGVASGIVPESAIITGTVISEKNRDRQILSKGGLIDAFTGQKIIIRRTNRVSGESEEEFGTIRSGFDRLILQTRNGYEAIYCDGLANTLIFPGVPADLTAKPTLSVLTGGQPGGRREITLSYLAGNFDWQANYVAEMAPDGQSMDLLAWMTMASSDQTSFTNANIFAVAGHVERQEGNYDDDALSHASPEKGNIINNCWPMDTTTTGRRGEKTKTQYLPPPQMQIRMAAAREPIMEMITVTATRIARQEDLGDLKLYQVPFPVTIAAQSQKQVAFLKKNNVKGQIIYRTQGQAGDFDKIEILYRVKNRTKDGLGIPLPAGKVMFFQNLSGQRHLIGESNLDDKTVDEEVDLPFAPATNVNVSITNPAPSAKKDDYEMTVHNANPFSIIFEAEFADEGNLHHSRFSQKPTRKNGKIIWRVKIPPNGVQKLNYHFGVIKTKK